MSGVHSTVFFVVRSLSHDTVAVVPKQAGMLLALKSLRLSYRDYGVRISKVGFKVVRSRRRGGGSGNGRSSGSASQ